MFKKSILVIALSCILAFLIFCLFDSESKNMLTRMIVLTNNKSSNGYIDNDLEVIELDISKQETNSDDADTLIENNTSDTNEEETITEEVVYDGMTMEQLASKLNMFLKNELSDKGYLYASYSLEKGVDPYLAVAISLEETGCNWNCSRLVKVCNNVGGMKGSGCEGYGYFNTLDDGIRAFIDNIYRNYVAYGLLTADTMNPKYAENPNWSTNVNAYINKIKNN